MAESEKRKEILKAGSECFAHYGYDKTTLEDIGRLVGLNKASLYYYFKSKDALFSEVILFEINESLDKIFESITHINGCKNKILTYLIERFRSSRNTVNLQKLTAENLKSFRPLFNGLCDTMMEKEVAFLSKILEGCISEGEIVPCEVERVAKSIITVAYAIKSKAKMSMEGSLNSNNECTAMEDEIAFAVSLMIDGITKN